MKRLNISSPVRVKITEFGMEMLKEQHEKNLKSNPELGEFTPPETDENGFCKMQLWAVMNAFAGAFQVGSLVLPISSIIYIDEECLNDA